MYFDWDFVSILCYSPILWIYPPTKDDGSSPPGWSETSDDIISLDWGISIMNLQFVTIASWGPEGRSIKLSRVYQPGKQWNQRKIFANLYSPTFKASKPLLGNKSARWDRGYVRGSLTTPGIYETWWYETLRMETPVIDPLWFCIIPCNFPIITHNHPYHPL